MHLHERASYSLRYLGYLLLLGGCNSNPEGTTIDASTLPSACIQAGFNDGSPRPLSIEEGAFTYPATGCLEGTGCARNDPTDGGKYLQYVYSQPIRGTFGLRAWIYPEAGWPPAFAGPQLILKCDNGNELRIALWSTTQAYLQQNDARATISHDSPEQGWTDALLLMDIDRQTLAYQENGTTVSSQALSAGCQAGVASIHVDVGIVQGYQAAFRFDSVKAGPAGCY